MANWTENRLLLSTEMAQQLRHSAVGNMMVKRYKQGKAPMENINQSINFFWNKAYGVAMCTLLPYCISKTYLVLPATVFGVVRNIRSSFKLCFWCVDADLPFIFGLVPFYWCNTLRKKSFSSICFQVFSYWHFIWRYRILSNLPNMKLIPRIQKHKWSNML